VSEIPDFMPLLAEGAHTSPQSGACAMEYVSYLAGEEWSDRPACVHPAIAETARVVNDCAGDEERQKLLPLLVRTMGTAEPDEGAPGFIFEPITPLGHHLVAARRVALRGSAYNWGSASVLEAVLDAYDEFTGRTKDEVKPLTQDALRQMAQLTGVAK
jgi:hypothetical protein